MKNVSEDTEFDSDPDNDKGDLDSVDCPDQGEGSDLFDHLSNNELPLDFFNSPEDLKERNL